MIAIVFVLGVPSSLFDTRIHRTTTHPPPITTTNDHHLLQKLEPCLLPQAFCSRKLRVFCKRREYKELVHRAFLCVRCLCRCNSVCECVDVFV